MRLDGVGVDAVVDLHEVAAGDLTASLGANLSEFPT